MPASELPASSSSGLQTAMAISCGTIATIPPPTPDFAGSPTRPGKLPRVLVHTAGRHQRVNLPRLHWRHHRFINMNSFPLIRQKDKRPGQLYTAHFQSAVMKVVLQNLLSRHDGNCQTTSSAVR